MNARRDHGHSPRLRRNLWKRTATAARAPKTLKLVCPEWRILVQINQESLPTGGLPCSAWERGVNPQGLLPSPRPQEAGGGRITARARQGGVAMKHLTWAVVVVGLLVAGSTLPAEAAGSRGGGGRGGGTQWHTGSPRGGRGWHTGSPRWHGGVHSGGGGWHGGTRVFIGGGLGWWGWPGWWDAPYPYYAAPPVVVPPAPTEYIQQAPAPPQQAYWYYCQNAGAYYPYVKECPGGWIQVVPAPTPPVP